MIKKITRAIAGILAFCTIAVFMATVAPSNSITVDAAAITQADIKKLEDKIAANDKKIKEATEKLKDISGDISNYLEIIEQIEVKISNLEANIADTESLIASYQVLIEQTEDKISDAEERIEHRYSDFIEIILRSFEEGTHSYLEMLFDSKSLVDFLTRADNLGAIISYEQSVLKEMESEVVALNEMKQTVQSSKEATEALAASQKEAEKELQNSLKEAEKQLDKLNADKASLEKVQTQASKLDTQLDKELEALIKKYQEQQEADANAKLLWPVDSFNRRISSPFGWRTLWGKRDYHAGIDIVGPTSGAIKGDNVYASDDGVVLISKYNSSYGNYIVIDHGNKLSTCYAHLSKKLVNAGDTVKRGQVIGYVGTTGNSSGYHLHFEVRVNGTKTDPLHKNGSKTESWMVINYNGKYVDPTKEGLV